jgi:hypothetical protein
MTYPATRGLAFVNLIGAGARENQTNSGVIDREDYNHPASVLFAVHAGSGATTISATAIHVYQSDTVSATASGQTAIASATTSGMTFTASGWIGLEVDLRNRKRFIGVTLSSPNVATSGVNGVLAVLSDGQTSPPGTSVDGFVNVKRVGQNA